MSTHDPDHLRRRARTLRTLATTIESTPAMALDAHAGSDTWRTPRADLCRWILSTNQAQVHRAAEELRWDAHRLERRAAEIELERAALGGVS
ncbi:MAG: hypothetical protein EA389_05195 [Ilumatobacter sp.]|nr:MAG: hypothetical protein EA389_05195 [Ilumatobacter sp.]